RHEVERGERAIETTGVRSRQHRVPGHGDHPPYLTFARRVDLLREADDRQLAEELWQPAHAGVTPAEPDAAPDAGCAARVRAPGSRLREHRATRAIEVPRQTVHDVDEHARQRPEPLTP